MERLRNVIEKLVDSGTKTRRVLVARIGQKELQILTIGTGTSLVVAILIAFFSQNIVIGNFKISTIHQAIIVFILFCGLTVFQSLRVPLTAEVISRGNQKKGEGGEDLEEPSPLAQLGDLSGVMGTELEDIDDNSRNIILELIRENRRLQDTLDDHKQRVRVPSARLSVEDVKPRLPVELQHLYDSLPEDMRLEIQKIYGIISDTIEIQREVSLAELENEQYIAPQVKRNYVHRRSASGDAEDDGRRTREPRRVARQEDEGSKKKTRKPRKRLKKHR